MTVQVAETGSCLDLLCVYTTCPGYSGKDDKARRCQAKSLPGAWPSCQPRSQSAVLVFWAWWVPMEISSWPT